MLWLGLGTKTTWLGLGKHTSFGRHKHGWKCPAVPFKTPDSVDTNTAAEGPTSRVLYMVLAATNTAKNTMQAPTEVAVLTPSSFVFHRRPLHLPMLEVSVVLQKC